MEAKLNLRFRKKGVFLIETHKRRKTTRKIAEPIRIRAMGKRVADDVAMSEVRFKTEDGYRSEYFVNSMLLQEQRRQIRIRLADLQYEWPEDKRLSQAILDAVATQRPKRRFMLVPAPGWYDAGYVLPGELFAKGGSSSIEVRIDPNTDAHVGAFAVGEGSLRGWKDGVARPSQRSSRLRLAIAAGFAAAFLRPLGMDSFAINLFGDTSQGKTIALKVAASVDGNLAETGLPAWADTDAGIEDQLRGHRDCVMALDETADGDQGPAELQAKARKLAFAIARNRPRKLARTYERGNSLTGRESRNIILSSSERALGAIAKAAGGKRLGGEDIRFTDIPVDERRSSGIFDGKIKPRSGFSKSETTKAMVEEIVASARKHQGHAKRALLERYVADADGLTSIKTYKSDFESKAKVGDANKLYRIRSNFALMYAAAALAIDYDILPWKKALTFRAVEKCMSLAIAELTPMFAAGPATSAIDAAELASRLKKAIAECTIVTVEPRRSVTSKEVLKRQAADAFKIEDALYLKSDRLDAWFPARADRSALISHVKKMQVLKSKRNDTSTVEKKFAGIAGKRRYHLFDLTALN